MIKNTFFNCKKKYSNNSNKVTKNELKYSPMSEDNNIVKPNLELLPLR